jgi:hypothetical protein
MIDEKFQTAIKEYFSKVPTVQDALQFSQDWSKFDGVNDDFFRKEFVTRLQCNFQKVLDDTPEHVAWSDCNRHVRQFQIICNTSNNPPAIVETNHYILEVYTTKFRSPVQIWLFSNSKELLEQLTIRYVL